MAAAAAEAALVGIGVIGAAAIEAGIVAASTEIAEGDNVRVVTRAPFGPGNVRVALFLSGVLAAALDMRPAAAQAKGSSVKLTVGRDGFEPRRVNVGLGVAHFSVTAREGDHCFAIPSLDIERRVRASRALEIDVTFEKVGEYPFHCCVEGAGTSETGTIVVAAGR